MKFKKIANVAMASVMVGTTVATSITSVLADEPNQPQQPVVLSTEEQATVDKFKEDYKVILSKKLEEVVKLDKETITKALNEYDKFNANVKQSLKSEHDKLKDFSLRIEHVEKTDKFKEDHKVILAKKLSDVDMKDKDSVSKAVNDFNALVDPVKAMLKTESDLLKSFSTKINNEISNSNAVKTFKENHKEILAMELKDIKPENLAKIDKALEDFAKLSTEQKDVLKTEKAKLDSFKAKLTQSDVDKNAAEAFKTKFKSLLSKDVKDIKDTDKDVVKQAIAEFDKMPKAQRDLLAKESELLNKFNNVFTTSEADKKVVEAFKLKYKTILGLNEANINNSHATDVRSAVADYNAMTQAQKDMLKDEHAKLATFAKKLNISLEERRVDGTTVSTVDAFRNKYKDILGKTSTDSLTQAELNKVNAALDEYDKMNDTDKEALRAEKEKLDALKKAKITKADPKTGNVNAIVGVAGAIGTMIAGAGAYLGSKKLGKREE